MGNLTLEPVLANCTNKWKNGCRMINAGFPSFFGSGLEDCHVPTLRLSLLVILQSVLAEVMPKSSSEEARGAKQTSGMSRPNLPVWVGLRRDSSHLLSLPEGSCTLRPKAQTLVPSSETVAHKAACSL